MNGFVFLLMMLSQMNPEDLVMQLKRAVKKTTKEKILKEKNLKHGGSNFNVPSF